MFGNGFNPYGFPMAPQPPQQPGVIYVPVMGPQQPQLPHPPRGGKKNKSSRRKNSLKDLLQEAIDNKESLEAIIEKLQKKDNDKKDDKKKDKGSLSYLEASGLMVITALPLALVILGMAKLVTLVVRTLMGM